MIQVIVWILTIPAVLLIVIPLLPIWPEIPQSVFTLIASWFGQLLWFNKYLPIDTLFTYAGYVLTIEFTIYFFRMYDTLRSAATGAKPIFTFGRFRNPE